ncbi:TetR family transcriptional regulator [Agrobacterium sp. ATCC 31749]|uniref:TetR/AcrR family transcriptional regulator n=1 Tax=unclassified Agrobacterium TaxID=2632611 RepID=UPI00020DBD53|nr:MULTISPECIES: TetR/AcrR family transcriptional regulator [unclassified Agrobacterium]EGL62204.1 TetR family transcriptional regulator [Agrobacterium sp. ATCC 31749]QKX00421.1 TetR family transcriptional regulator [Agrobacterium sp. CGMCC 11546]
MNEAPPKRRMSPDMREQEIVRGAIGFFAEFGFEGQTRELAKRLGITQPLLYRYFPNKEALVERVYQEGFVRRWNPFWEELITNRNRPLEDRLREFYRDYADAILTYEWVRLFMFSGLKGLDFNARYLNLLRQRIFNLIIQELRFEHGRQSIEEKPVTNMEIEAIWGLHAAIFYLGVRKFIYNLPVDDTKGVVEMELRIFLKGVVTILG